MNEKLKSDNTQKKTWASTPLEHWGSQVERRRRENRGAVGGEGVGFGEGLKPEVASKQVVIRKLFCSTVELKTVHWAHCR